MWKTIESKEIFRHPRIVLLEDIVELPSGEQVPYLKYEASTHAATIICQRGDEVLLQREYSYPPNEVLYQFPGGKTEEGEGAAVAAKRELAEEAGLKAAGFRELGWFYMDNRRSSARMYVYLATDITETEQIGGDIEEDISSHWTSIDEVDRMIKDGEIRHCSILAAWAMFKAAG